MNRQQSYVIIGNGIAGVTAAETLRAEDTHSSITIIADDPFPVYYRPALKDYLAGHVPEEKLWARPTTFYKQHRIRFVQGHVSGIHHIQHVVQLHDGQQMSYDRLLLASGARSRQLDCPGSDLPGVITLRTLAEYQEVQRRLAGISRIVVCGSGTLALETAETLNKQGYEVIHLLRYSTLWSEVLDTTASDLVLQEERRAGIEVRLNETIKEIAGKKGRITGVITTNENRIACDLVLIAIGIEPHIGFIQASGIICGRGVRIDENMRTNIADIYAAGDVAEIAEAITGCTRVLGQWYPAVQQARAAAYSMLGLLDTQQPFRPGTFYNATSLHGLDFAAIGLTALPTQYQHYLQEVLAPPHPRTYRKVVLKDGLPFGALFLGDRQEALAFKRAIDHRANLSPVLSHLFTASFSLDVWLDEQQIPGAMLEISPVNVREKEAILTHAQQVSHFTRGSAPSTLPGGPTLVLARRNVEPSVIPLMSRNTFTIGRNPANDLVLADRAVSREHAELLADTEGYAIRDLGSSYGVFVNKIKINGLHHLTHGDRIIIGDTLLHYSFLQQAQHNQAHAQPAAIQISPEQGLMPGVKHRTDVRELTARQLRFEIDMCIGCDRCMVACPIPASSLLTIAELNRATLSDQISEQVAHFTHECIMCGSCVPVCPVDNHRDLMMLSLKQRIGHPWEGKGDAEPIVQQLPEGWNLETLLNKLHQQPLFSQGNENYLLHLCASSRLLAINENVTLLHEGAYGRDVYFILEGYLSLATIASNGSEMPLAVFRYGEYFGEQGMLTGQPHNATVRTQTPAIILQVPEQAIQHYLDLVPSARDFFEKRHNAYQTGNLLKRMQLFQGTTDKDIDLLIQQAQIKNYTRNERLFTEQGNRPARETLHVLLEGFVKVARQITTGADAHKERIIAYRQGGDYFVGGLDLLGDGKAVTVTAINRVRVAEIPRHAILTFFQHYPEIHERFTQRLKQYIESTVSAQSGIFEPGLLTSYTPVSSPATPPVRAALHSLVSDGVVEGTDVLIIDLHKCIHCAECEEACARRHGQSRMNRKGMIVGNISITTSCRHCSDPVCMLCSRAGIARHADGEVYITESCIGCGICVERCPYGAISLLNVPDETATHSAWQRFQKFFKRSTSEPLEEIRKKIAIKCDLCVGYSNQACVDACPTGAAIRVQPTRFFGSTEDILQVDETP